MKYAEALTAAMQYLAQDPRVLFLGQAVAVPGTAMSNTLAKIDLARRVELPVEEEMQMGMCNGLALAGLVPVCIFPRWNFLLLAANQIINHLDKFAVMSNGACRTKVIIRTSIGAQRPMHPQMQHIGDYTDAFRAMCTTIDVIRLDEANEVLPAYEKALTREDGRSTLIIEHGDYHNEK